MLPPASHRKSAHGSAWKVRGLVEARKLPGGPPTKGRELLILTLDQEDSLTQQDLTIRILPACN